MRRIINGMAYDTDAAELLARGDHDHELSQASWSLYRSRNGAFFEVYAGHDGVVESFTPLSLDEARRFVEVNANHLLEKYFGPVPEAGPAPRFRHRFSRRTVLASIDMLDALKHAELSRFLLELGPEFPGRVGDESKSLPKRLNSLIEVYDSEPDRVVDGRNLLADVLVEKATSLISERRHYPRQEPEELPEREERFLRQLAADGYVVNEMRLQAALPQDIGLPGLQDELRTLLRRHGFTTSLGHLDQAIDGHARANWATANGQLRSFFESLLDDIAVKLDPTAVTLKSDARRERLAKCEFLKTDLNEWGADGKNYVNGLWKRLHPQGSHPGLSDEEDSTFRLHIVLLTAHLFMSRFTAMSTDAS